MTASTIESRVTLGVDVGATLAKLAVRGADGVLRCEFLPADAQADIIARIAAAAPETIGVSGCGATELEGRLDRPVDRFVEFEAWGAGSRALLTRQSIDAAEPYVLASVGTGTSVLRVHGARVDRLGGTALGGGTVLGLGVALTGCESHGELCDLARGGERGNVDLLVSHIYEPGEIAIPGEVTAASFGNLARWLSHGKKPAAGDPSRREDLAASVMGLVGENVALICCGLANAAQVRRVVYGGATLVDNPALLAVLMGVTAGMGCQPILLDQGGYAGAVGAMVLASGEAQV